MFRGTGTTSSVIQAAGASGGGCRARPKTLVVLVKTKAFSRRFRVPVMLVSTKSCRLCVATWGLCRVAAWMTASTLAMASDTKPRSATDPT